MKEITADELKYLIDKNVDFQLIDVREEYEHEESNINGDLIPMGEIMDNVDKVSKTKQVIFHCRSGKRSASVINALENQFGFNNLYNLRGGIVEFLQTFPNK
ncbi:MAG: rhodanese-like domain-containing protein [Bacteroidetes bacterium]|nr:rhodanese-like domain-containing protein [Bacteroidota bacterium]